MTDDVTSNLATVRGARKTLTHEGAVARYSSITSLEAFEEEDVMVLRLEDLRVSFKQGRRATKEVLRGVTWEVRAGEVLAIVGESGSGKSVSAQAALGLLPKGRAEITGGRVLFDGQELDTTDDRAMNAVRGSRVSLIYQDALSSLNPVQRIGDQIAEVFRYHQGMGRREAARKSVKLLDSVSLPSAESQARRYPHELSGGMRQRVLIAMALALDPAVVIADEPTTALDVTIQAEILELLRSKQRELGLSIVIITHDLGVVANFADRVCVMYAGKVVEEGPTTSVLRSPAHPYTLGLIDSVPSLMGDTELDYIPGQPVDFRELPPGCSFNPRCRFRTDICLSAEPNLQTVQLDHRSACHYAPEVFSGQAHGSPKADSSTVEAEL